MLGEKIGESTGQVSSQRVLPGTGGGARMETTFQDTGSLLGIGTSGIGTYVTTMRPDGTLFGEGQGMLMGKGGEAATWCGQGVGTVKKDGALAFRGAIYIESAAPAWARLNAVAVVYEYETDAQGRTRAQNWEWR